MDARSHPGRGNERLRPLGPSERNRWMVSEATADLVRWPVPPRPLAVPAANKQITFDLSHTAIVIVDMQNDFCHPDGWLAHIGVDVTPARFLIPVLSKVLPALGELGQPPRPVEPQPLFAACL